MRVSVFPNINATRNLPEIVDVDSILEWIQSGSLGGIAEAVEKIRGTENKDVRNILKGDLPSIVFAGECTTPVPVTDRNTGEIYDSYRKDRSLSKHSGLCIVDFDKIERLDELKWEVMTIPQVYAAFVSPSGDGLKVLFRIPDNIERHKGHYKTILAFLRTRFPHLKPGINIDPTSANIARVCYVSHDPEIYINRDATIWDKYEQVDEPDTPVVAVKGSGLTDFSKLQIAARMIDLAEDGTKHSTLVKAAYLMGGYITSGTVQEEDARKMLRDRIKARNPESLEKAHQTIEDGMEEGKRKPIFEIERIEEEFQLEALDKKFVDRDRGFVFLEDRDEANKRLDDVLENGIKVGSPLGLPEIDDFFVMKENTFSVVLGHAGTGKTTFVYWVAVVAAIKLGWKWIIYSSENESYQMKRQLISFILGKPANEGSKRQVAMARALIDKHFYFIRTDKSYSIFEMLNFGKVLCKHDPQIKGFMIDPYNSLVPDYENEGKRLNPYEYMIRALTEIKQFSRKYCSVYVSAHSTTDSRRAGKPDEDGYTKRPFKAEIDGGSMWDNKCDDFYVIHRHVHHPSDWRFTEIHVDKIREYESGGKMTRGADIPKIKLSGGVDFVGSDGVSPLRDWRHVYFGGPGVQKNMNFN